MNENILKMNENNRKMNEILPSTDRTAVKSRCEAKLARRKQAI